MSNPPSDPGSLPSPALFDGQLVVEIDTAVPAPRGVLRVGGEIDIATVPQLTHAIRRAAAGGRRYLELDVSSVSFCDVVGLTALERARRRLRVRGGRLTLRGSCPSLLLLLAVTRPASPLVRGVALPGRDGPPAGGRPRG